MSKPNPTCCLPTYDPEIAASRRKLHCRYMNRCLSYAAKRGWQAMSCESCHASEPLDPGQELQDRAVLSALATGLERGWSPLRPRKDPEELYDARHLRWQRVEDRRRADGSLVAKRRQDAERKRRWRAETR